MPPWKEELLWSSATTPMDVIERTRDTAILRAVLARDGVRSVDLYLARIVDDAQPRLRIAEDGSPVVEHVYP